MVRVINSGKGFIIKINHQKTKLKKQPSKGSNAWAEFLILNKSERTSGSSRKSVQYGRRQEGKEEGSVVGQVDRLLLLDWMMWRSRWRWGWRAEGQMAQVFQAVFTECILWMMEDHGKLSVQFSRSVVSDSLQSHESQHARPPCPSPSPGVHSGSRPSSPWCHPAISSSVVPSPPAPNPSQHQSLFQWVNSSHEVAKVLELQL